MRASLPGGNPENPCQARNTNAMMEQECCIVGAGPAGMMLGLLLARAGVMTTVIEKQTEILRDYRGDTIHPSTLEVIDQLGFLDELLAIPHQEATTLHAEINGKTRTLADFTQLPTRCKFLVFMPQKDFLAFLVSKASQYPNFRLLSGCEAVALIERGGRVAGVVTRDEQGNENQVEAALVVGADGRGSTVRKAAKLQIQTVGTAIDVLWTCVSRLEGDRTLAVDHIGPNQGMVMIDRGDHWQIAYTIPQGSFRQTKIEGIAALRDRLAAIAPLPAERFDELTDWSQVHLLKAKTDRLQQWWKPGLLCIGDAAHTMSPIGGVGASLAIQDAIAAANILAVPLREKKLTPEHLGAVQKRRSFPTRATQRIQLMMRHSRSHCGDTPGRTSWIIRLISSSSMMQNLVGRLVGIGLRPEKLMS